MDKMYSLKPVHFKKLQIVVFITILPVIAIVFFSFGTKENIASYLYAVFSFLTLLVIITVFYLNRNEVSDLMLSDEYVSAQYFNKSFFKRKPLKEKRISILANMVGDDLIYLYRSKEVVATIRKGAMEQSEWQEIREYFKV